MACTSVDGLLKKGLILQQGGGENDGPQAFGASARSELGLAHESLGGPLWAPVEPSDSTQMGMPGGHRGMGAPVADKDGRPGLRGLFNLALYIYVYSKHIMNILHLRVELVYGTRNLLM